MRSLRLKLSLFFVALFGSIMMVFGGWLFLFTGMTVKTYMQRGFESLIQVQGSIHRDANEWRYLERILGDLDPSYNLPPLLLLTFDHHGRVEYQSDDWPSDLVVDDLMAHAVSALTNRTVTVFDADAVEEVAERGYKKESWERWWVEEGQGDFFPPTRDAEVDASQIMMVTRADASGKKWLMVFGPSNWPSSGGVGLLLPLDAMNQTRTTFFIYFLTMMGAFVVMMGGVGWWLASRALFPVELITEITSQVSASELHERVPLGSADEEFEPLIEVINRLLEKLEQSYEQTRRFSADSAHELKTPLTLLYGRIEQGMQGAMGRPDVLRKYARFLEEVEHLTMIIRNLVFLSEVDAGELILQTKEVDLSELIREMDDTIRHMDETLKVETRMEESLVVEGDEQLLRQAFHHLIKNAVHYNDEGGRIKMVMTGDYLGVEIRIANTSSLADGCDAEHVFDRFYRGSGACRKQKDGQGLGLSLAQEIIQTHRGRLERREERAGWVGFRVWLPAVRSGV